MKLMVALPTDLVDRPDEFVTGPAVMEMARHAEQVGLGGVFVTDHPAPDDRWLAGGGHHSLEPTVALSFAAAATSTLRLITNVYVAAYRPPLLAAKTLASLDALSGGRLIVGVAAGYLRPEFRALGVDFDTRGALLNEAIDTMRAAWSGNSVAADGHGWSTKGTTILPTPVAGAALPIWGGGNSLAAMKRVVARCDGWMPFGTPPGMAGAVRTAEISTIEHLAERLALLERLCAEAGRTQRPTVSFNLLSSIDDTDALATELTQVAAVGVDWASVMLPSTIATREHWLERVGHLAELAARVGLER
ncbi:MAG: TIGR03619 family F420-dependent LLM class oxidoreductase [Actinobacteria bacterium]|nr:TIGR03619 family F420-dependent LLM class oxidoreductase [Actinomycetota bacterium]